MTAMGRLKPGVSIAQAQSAINVIAERLANQYPSADKGIFVRVVPETRSRPNPGAGNVLPAIAGLFLGLAGLVLLLVCLNVGNILLARATVRRREMTIRVALGAGRVRLVRQILTETVLLGLLGGVAGVILGTWAIRSVPSTLPSTGFPLNIDFRFDWRVLAYTVAAALCTGIIIGLWPALLAARTNLNAVLHEGGRSDSAGVRRNRAGRVLVVMQVAGSLSLLIVAAVFVRSLEHAERMYLGFDPSYVLNVVLDPHEIGYDDARTNEFYRELEEKVRATPGVQTASLAHSVPMGVFGDGRLVNVEGHPPPTGQPTPAVAFNSIDPAYFETMRIPLLRGRAFKDSDNDRASLVAIVNQTMADRFWPGEEPIGKRFSISGAAGPFVEIVGIAANGKYGSMSETAQPYFYLPLVQNHPSMRTLQVRSSVPPESLLAEVQQEVRNLAPDLPIFNAETMEQSLNGPNGYFIYRFGATMAGVMGVIGLTLAVVGVYGVVSFSTAQRVHEIGIRMALGAQRRDVLRLVLRQGLTVVFAGVIAGVVGGWALTRAMGRFTAGPSEAGPLIFGGAALLLASVALLACWIPARRAMRVDPMVALRYE
jgi:predicted permease